LAHPQAQPAREVLGVDQAVGVVDLPRQAHGLLGPRQGRGRMAQVFPGSFAFSSKLIVYPLLVPIFTQLIAQRSNAYSQGFRCVGPVSFQVFECP